MPEGDTLHRIEATLSPLVGHRVEACCLPGPGIGESVVGDDVDVEAICKNLRVAFRAGSCCTPT
jgi:hypothetical protein